MTHLEPLRHLHSSQEYLRLLDAMPVMLWTADHTGRWHHINRRWADYTGITGVSAGFGFEEALHPDDIPATLARWRAAIRSAEPYEIEYRLRNREGAYRWFLIRGVQALNEVREGIAWVGTCTDIEDQKRAEQDALSARAASLRVLGLALEARDRETYGHTERVAGWAQRLGERMKLSPAQLGDLGLGAALHDLGKVAVPDSILLKAGALDAAERHEMQRHTTEGERLVRSLEFVSPGALALIRHHHERWDGQGYPDGLRGEAIPLLARLFTVIDVADALLSERPYKRAWTLAETVAELRAQAGRQLDPQLVPLVVDLLHEGS